MQALALKYRPKNFAELIGQDVIASSLSRALDSERLGHAYLFSGLRGSGKTSSARIFAKALLCQKGVSSHPCEVCQSCVMANEGRHLDIIELDAASHRSIDDIRDLTEQTRYAPMSGRFKIFIIDEAHMLTQQACNALLKTLEEPPSYIKFILATTDPLKLPATILSRTQHFRFKPISIQNIVHHLEFILSKEGIKYEIDALNILARAGEGSLRDTLTLLDQAIIFTHENISATQIADMLGILDPAKIDEILKVVQNGVDADISALIKELNESDAVMIINELISNLKFKFISPNPSFSLLIFERFFRILSQAKNMLNSGSDAEFVLYITLFMMKECFNIPNIDNVILNAQSSLDNKTNQNLPKSAQTPTNATNFNPQPNQPAPTNQAQKPSSTDMYERFLGLIYDRNYELGECFKECICFDGFENGIISLSSRANNEQSAMQRKYWGVIKELALASFGSDKFKVQKIPNDLPKSDDDVLNNILSAQNVSPNPSNIPSQNASPNPSANDNPNASDKQISTNEISITPSSEQALSKDELRNINELNILFGEPEIIEDKKDDK